MRPVVARAAYNKYVLRARAGIGISDLGDGRAPPARRPGRRDVTLATRLLATGHGAAGPGGPAGRPSFLGLGALRQRPGPWLQLLPRLLCLGRCSSWRWQEVWPRAAGAQAGRQFASAAGRPGAGLVPCPPRLRGIRARSRLARHASLQDCQLHAGCRGQLGLDCLVARAKTADATYPSTWPARAKAHPAVRSPSSTDPRPTVGTVHRRRQLQPQWRVQSGVGALHV